MRDFPVTKLLDQLFAQLSHQAVHLCRPPENQATILPVLYRRRYAVFRREQRNGLFVDSIRREEALPEIEF